MSGNTLGLLFSVTTFGESHGPAIGCVIDGCPPGLSLSEADLQPDLDRRKPGTSRHVTQRKEDDVAEILSGVFEGVTTGTPIAILIRNTDQRSKDYGNIAETFRPGHADYTYWMKYGQRDHRGGGRSSARLTAPIVAAGAIAKKWLGERFGIAVRGHCSQIGSISIPFETWDDADIAPDCGPSGNPFFAAVKADSPKLAELENYMDELRKSGDSCGAKIYVEAVGAPVGWGEPLYDRLDADIAHAMMGLNAVKGVEIGAGFASVTQSGTEHSDEIRDGKFATNNAGGVLGGISTGQPITVNIAIKPTSSIRLDRKTIDKKGNAVTINTHGRHDPCVGIRATPIAEALLAIVLMDHALRHRAQNADVVVDTPKVFG
jgi:chorismate synthase